MPHILVVEDNDDIRDALRGILVDERHAVACAADGRAAQEAFTARRPDLVIVDLHLGDGATSTPLIAQWTRVKSAPPIILMSACREEARAVGAQYGLHVVDKPFSVSKMLATIEGLLSSTTPVLTG